MKNVKIKMVGLPNKVVPNVFVDGEFVNCKKNNFGSYEAEIQTEKDDVEITISRYFELKSKLWWLYALISFIVSIFGILEPPYDKKCISINCLFKVKLNDDNNQITIQFNTLKPNGKAAILTTNNQFEEIKNEYFVDKTVKVRKIILLVIKLLVWIGIAILVGYFISKLF